jgi:prepilin-type N-terminal cleavage/methylation domain-containing protein
MSHYPQTSARQGFTIVELLIVIVVIGILAAITIVAYNGIQDRARVSAVSSALSQAAKKLAVYQVDNPDLYPADKNALEALGIKDSGTITYEYTRTTSTPNTYCITATTGATSYKVSSTSATPSSGGCAGHGVGGVPAITNIVNNPSFESNTTSTGVANGATITRQASSAIVGGFGIRVSAPANGIGDSGVNLPTGNMTSGTTYTFSASIRSLIATSYRISIQGSYGSGNSPLTPFAAGEVKRLSATVTATGTGKPAVYILRNDGNLVTNFDVDGVMQTEGSTLYNYADGGSSNWVWNGTTDNATSTGPPV